MKHIPLNVNIPAIPPGEIRGILIVKQGRARLIESFEKRVDPRENIYYWLAGETQITEYEGKECDAAALKDGWITITPLHFDLTRHDVIDELRASARKALGKAVSIDGEDSCKDMYNLLI